VVVTSRNQLTGLVAGAGARPVLLDRFTPAEARLVLTRRIGAERVSAEPLAVEELIARCARLPLALVIVAARAATRPRLPLQVLADELRLDNLVTEDDLHTDVRAVLSASYRALLRSAARLFRLLGWFPGRVMGAEAVAAMAGLPLAAARKQLDVLATSHLLETDPDGRYGFHDLLHAYAVERANAEAAAGERAEAAGRLLAWHLHATVTAAQLLEPGRRTLPDRPSPSPSWRLPFDTRDEALAWFDREQSGAVARARLAGETGHDELGWKLFTESGGYFLLRRSRAGRIAHGLLALRSVRRTGDRYGEAYVLNGLGLALGEADRRRALFSFRRALRIRHEIGDLAGAAATLNNLGPVYWDQGRFDESLDCFRQALAIARRTSNQHSQVVALNNLGEIYRRLGRFADALDVQEQALTLSRELNHPVSEGNALHNLGGIHRESGRLDRSRAYFEEAVAVRRRHGDRHGEASSLVELGSLRHVAGEAGSAVRSWRQALTIFEELDAPEAAETRRRIDDAGLPHRS